MGVRIVIFILAIFFSFSALACSCVAPNMEQGTKAYNQSDVVLKGTITNKSDGWEGLRPLITVNVIDVIKGYDIPENLTADYNKNTAACGNNFNVGDDYIIAMFDTRSLILTDENIRGYGFRAMPSCHQYQVRDYIKNKQKKETE